MNIIKYILIAVISYLLGCISSGVIVAKAFGVKDIRKEGSGNAGTTNVLRTLGWLPSVLTLAGDCIKGVIACLVGKYAGGEVGALFAGLCVTLGHDFPVFLGFRGGKGIAVSLGMLLVISPALALTLVVVELIIIALTRYVSLASLSVTVAYPVLNYIFFHNNEHFGWYMFFAVICGLLSLYCHRSNLMRLIRHEENRLDFKKISKITSKLKTGKKN